MGPLLQTSVLLWISFGFLFVGEKSAACPEFRTGCEFDFRDVCFEFVRDLKTWVEARSSCEEHGGQLLDVMDQNLESFLTNISSMRNTSRFSWWLGEDVQREDQELTRHTDVVPSDLCSYLKLNPLQVMKSDCNLMRSFLCTHALRSSSSTKKTMLFTHNTKYRLRRDLTAMSSYINDIEMLVNETADVLEWMEQTEGEPTNDNRDNFIKILLDASLNISSEFAASNKDTLHRIIKSASGILRLSLKKCDLETNPNPISLFEKIFEIFREIALLLGEEYADEFVLKHPSGNLYQRSLPTTDLGNLILGSVDDGEWVKFPSYSTLAAQLSKYERVTAQVATFNQNPHPTDDNITGSVCNVLLSNLGSDIVLKGLSEPVEIFLPRPNPTQLINNTVVLLKNTKSVTTMNISDANVTIFFSVEPNANVSLNLTLFHGSLTDPTFPKNTTILSQGGGYRWLITPDMLRYTPGTWYIDARLHESEWTEGLSLKITSFTTKCMYWDIEREIWSVDGCTVGDKSTPQLTQCLCYHLTLFGSSFFVMPNFVDVSRTAELFATVNENYVVLALLCAFFALYLITLFWAIYSDRRARYKRKMTLLEDNHPGAQYNYLISVQTGHRSNAGTTANVTVMLTGSEGESTIHTLTDPIKPVFERGAADMFLLAAPFPLGDLRNLRLQHDNSGGRPSWYINKVVVQDLQTRQVWHFLCDCWLSADRGDGMTKKTFNVAKSNEIACFRNIFTNRTSTGFRDEHIWVSIVDPPSRSPFTRAQRVSCCMSLLLCTMAINIAFWNLPVDKDAIVILSIGSMQITWQEIIVGVESGLLMFPINILIITIFRSIRPRVVSKSKNEEEDLRPPSVTVPSVLKDTEEVISLVSKSPRNKFSEMPKLESTRDLLSALDKVHMFIQNMQGETESDPHWVHSSRFLLAGLCHLLLSLEKLDAKHFSSPQEYQQILSLTNLLVRKAEMVFSSHLADSPPPVKRKKKVASCWLPWWCVFLGWFLLLSISGISTFFTLLYGFQYGKEKSIKWVISLALSLFQSIFILQPLKVIGIAVFFALLLKPVAVDETEEAEHVLGEQQEKCKQYTGRPTL